MPQSYGVGPYFGQGLGLGMGLDNHYETRPFCKVSLNILLE